MSETSSDGSNAHEEDESTRGSHSVVLHNTWTSVKPKTTFLLKGGANADDEGAEVTIGVDTRLQAVYTGLARRLGLRPSDIRLYYCGKLLAYNETPFKMGFVENYIVLVYEKDCTTPVIVRPPTEASVNGNIVFCVRSMETLDVLEQFKLPPTTPVELLYKIWAARLGAQLDPKYVRMYMDHKKIDPSLTLDQVGVYEGAYLYGALKTEAKDCHMKKQKLVE